MFCRICGEEKDKKEFYKLKNFSRYFSAKKFFATKKFWCRDCMRMFIEMRTEQEKAKELQQKVWNFVLKFD
jgi:hypothetical protein